MRASLLAIAMVTNLKGLGSIKTGDRTFCFIGEWDDVDSLTAARPAMIGFLGTLRDLLEDLGGGLGVTDSVSGTVVAEVKA